MEQRWGGVADEGLRRVEELAGGDRAGGEDAAAGGLRQVHADRRRAAGGGRRGGEEAAAEEHEPCREEDAGSVAKRSRPLVLGGGSYLADCRVSPNHGVVWLCSLSWEFGCQCSACSLYSYY